MRDPHCPKESKHSSISCLGASWTLLTPRQLASHHASFTAWLAAGASCSEDLPAGDYPSLASLKNILHTQNNNNRTIIILVKAEKLECSPGKKMVQRIPSIKRNIKAQRRHNIVPLLEVGRDSLEVAFLMNGAHLLLFPHNNGDISFSRHPPLALYKHIMLSVFLHP